MESSQSILPSHRGRVLCHIFATHRSSVAAIRGCVMCRWISLVLIPLLLVGQSFGLAHTHRGTDVAESKDHAVRPHIHTHGSRGHHHHRRTSTVADRLGRATHRHQADALKSPEAASWRSADDHDDDAVYVSTAVTIGVNSRLAAGDSIVRSIVGHDAGTTDKTCQHLVGGGLVLGLPPPVSLSRVPLFLRNLSLRI